MRKMKVCRALFGELLRPLGFEEHAIEDSGGHFVMRRVATPELYHDIGPALVVAGDRLEVWAYPTSPIFGLLDPEPDHAGIIPGMPHFLSRRDGVGWTPQTWPCETKEELSQVFETDIKPLILNRAIPFLDTIRTVADILPLLQPDPTGEWFKGLALLHCGRKEEAKAAFLAERKSILDAEEVALKLFKGRRPASPSLEVDAVRLRWIEETLKEL